MAAPLSALACDDGQTRHFASTFAGGAKIVEVCHNENIATYTFGRTGETADLSLTRPVAEVGLVPWPGIGRTIWEEIVFQNQQYTYVVYASIERNGPQNEDEEIAPELSGALLVRRGENEVADLACDPGSVDFPWSTALFDAKTANGQCYDPIARIWQACDQAN